MIIITNAKSGNPNFCNRMLRDAEYFKTRLGGLDGAGDTGDYIVNLVKEKPVPKSKAAPEPKPQAEAPVEANGKSSAGPGSQENEEKVAREEKEQLVGEKDRHDAVA